MYFPNGSHRFHHLLEHFRRHVLVHCTLRAPRVDLLHMVDVERQLVPLVAVAAQYSEWEKLVGVALSGGHLRYLSRFPFSPLASDFIAMLSTEKSESCLAGTTDEASRLADRHAITRCTSQQYSRRLVESF